ncbi:family 20 glycosylhydrolase [Bizionia myxarmorum]|uniref:beta-N-acetylhexosaminidase n=1 Tax=Bizionia myxarmorum TaxID=291186 RepID=A0A5D0RAB5_9FLAO|nr:family 20 glycosylhydrolase [Bizionia myxarmorum]TYB78427.1 family 20 glycosylhydrolase [Bizionia myxarmorum]
MQFKTSLISVVFMTVFFSCSKKLVEPITPHIIPIPLSQTIQNGYFQITNETTLSFEDEFSIAGNFLKNYVESGTSFELKSGEDIVFRKDETISNKEGYKLQVSDNGIIILANTGQGAFLAVQSLRQLLPVELENKSFSGQGIAVQNVKIEDEPKFEYRGMHLDVSRHMFPVEFIKKYIDAIAMLKMNTFHWHLTDDQGWRIEIKKYPKLQEIAAYRNETLIGHYNTQPQEFDGKRYGGYYTQEEIKDIVAYAGARYITVIPEIELPGHSQAAISAYPELGCTGNQVEVATKGGVFEDIYCPKEETFAFLEDVFDEVLELFPSTYIHIGGDEAPKTRWKNCEHCQALIDKEDLIDENGLQSYFITRIEKYINSKGRQIIGWDEILEGGLAPNATVMSWRGFEGAIEAAKLGHNVILTPGSHAYFDHYQSENKDEPLAIGGFLPLEKVYSFNPIPKELTSEQSKYVLGAQGNVWTEYMPNSKQVEYMVFPRILALSEAVWSMSDRKDYKDFVLRVENFHKRMDALDINYANHLYEIEGKLVTNRDQVFYEMGTAIAGKNIHYTLDGSEPTITSKIYKTGIPISKSETIKAAVFKDDKILGETFSQTINWHKAIGHKITLNVQPHHAYMGSGSNGLINGMSGSDYRYGDKEWLGFWGEDVEITIDLGVETEITSISTRFHNGNGQWIYAPKMIEIEFDNDEIIEVFIPETEGLLASVALEKNVKTRFIILRISERGIIPDGKQGAGNAAWTFIDEIVIQ